MEKPFSGLYYSVPIPSPRPQPALPWTLDQASSPLRTRTRRVHRGTVLFVLLLFPVATGCENAPLPSEDAVSAAVGSIQAEDARRRIAVLAHDSMGGRGTPSPGLDAAATWVADELRSLGLSPVGGEEFVHRYRIRWSVPDFAASWGRVAGGPPLRFGVDLGFPREAPDSQEAAGPIIVLQANDRAASALANTDVAGAHVIVIPGGMRDWRTDRASRSLLGRLRQSEAASIILVTRTTDRDWEGRIAEQEGRPSARMPWERELPPVLELRRESLSRLLATMGMAGAIERMEQGAQPMRFPEAPLTLRLRPRVLRVDTAPNVIARLPGSDPVSSREHVLVSAHLDHLGSAPPGPSGDSVYNGANDNASGVAAVLEVAEAIVTLRPRPRRSILFFLPSGEERGLLGSRAFAHEPPVPLSSIVAAVNLDMVGRNPGDPIYAAGRAYSEIGTIVDRIAEEYTGPPLWNGADSATGHRYFSRSDQYVFARRGIPSLLLFGGLHDEYHGRKDEVSGLSFERVAAVGRTAFRLVLELANRERRPSWRDGAYETIVRSGPR